MRRAIIWTAVLAALLILTMSCAVGEDEEIGYAPDDSGDDDDQSGPAAPEFPPDAPGPYAVGNTTRIFVDESRIDAFYDLPRTLMTEIWYPVDPEDITDDMEQDTQRSMLGNWYQLIIWGLGVVFPDMESSGWDMTIGSYRDAPIASAGTFPVVIFGHGNATFRYQNPSLCTYLASHGYIVAAADHTGNAMVSPLPERPLIYNPLRLPYDLTARQDDMRFLLDALELLNEGVPDTKFRWTMDTEHAALIGHSFGGTIVQEVLRKDERFSAGVTFASPNFPATDPTRQKGLLTFVGLEDQTLTALIPIMKLNNVMAPPPKALVEIKDAGHFTFTDLCEYWPHFYGWGDGCGPANSIWDGTPIDFVSLNTAHHIMNTYTTAWLDWLLRGEDTTDVLGDNLYPGAMHYTPTLE